VNLILGWHGGAKENIAFKIGEENFKKVGGIDRGFFGNGFYHTQSTQYGDLYREYKEQKGMPPDQPLILSWILMGKVYPVTEKATSPSDPNSLCGKPCKQGFNSHYALVKSYSNDPLALNFQPCNPTKEKHEYDEIVIFDADQILPRYLVYVTKVERKFACTVCWVDPSPDNNAAIMNKLENKGANIVNFPDSQSIIVWLNQNLNSQLLTTLKIC